MDRRSVLRMFSAAAAAPLVVRHGAAWAADDGMFLRLAWHPVGTAPVLTSPIGGSLGGAPGPANNQRMFPTVLPAGWLLPDAIDAWYLWLWTHDTSKLFLYTAPRLEGPWTARATSSMPAVPSGYVAGHVSSGDIVWDPAGRRFISNPHSIRQGRVAGNGEVCQDSFLIQSTDGVSWTWLDGDNSPRLLCGPPASVDSVHTGYGRLLRDLDGHIITFQDRYWWMYRAQRHDAQTNPNVGTPTYYAPGLASTPSLSTYPWAKHGAQWVTEQANTGLFDVGSFIRAGRQHSAVGAIGSGFLVPTHAYWNGTYANSMTFRPAAVPLSFVSPDGSNGLHGGANIIRHPQTRVQYAVTVAMDLVEGQYEVWLYRSVTD